MKALLKYITVKPKNFMSIRCFFLVEKNLEISMFLRLQNSLPSLTNRQSPIQKTIENDTLSTELRCTHFFFVHHNFVCFIRMICYTCYDKKFQNITTILMLISMISIFLLKEYENHSSISTAKTSNDYEKSDYSDLSFSF